MSSKQQQGAKVGLISRIDFGSKGFRRALLDAGFEILREEGTHFNILDGGLVSQKDLKEQMKDAVKKGIRQDKKRNRKYEGEGFKDLLPSERLSSRKKQLEDKFLEGVAKELATMIPVTTIPDPEDPKKEKKVDLFITPSPAFDGEIGEKVAYLMSGFRPDIRVWNVGGDRFPVLYVNKLIWALAPTKAVWMRGDYYSTAAERVIKDKIKQTSQSSPTLYIVGGFGSSINKPKGELKYAYVSIPALHRLEETRVSENQIGVSVLEFPSDNSQYLFRTYNLKDLVSQELSFVVAPDGASSLQKKMIEIIKSRGWATPGILRNQLGDENISAEKVVKEMDGLMKKKTFRKKGENWPGIIHQKTGNKYYFDLEWVQRRLKYGKPVGILKEDRVVSFACLHVGSNETDYRFFLEELPQIILKNNANILVDAGDTKEGLRHNLDRKGEVMPGLNNNTKQEKVAANVIGSVLFKVFTENFNKFLNDNDAELKKLDDKMKTERIEQEISKALITFIYILGNHDLWETDDGHDPLEVFRLVLVAYLVKKITKHLTLQGIAISLLNLTETVESKILLKDFFELPSGLKVSVQHPHMARAKTTSIRPQEMLEFAKRHGCQVAIGANFHVAENVEEWDMDLGQCVSHEIGTIKHGSNFERHKMKMVDQGVGWLRICSRDKRILMTESAFYGAPEVRSPVDNKKIINDYLGKMGVDPI